MRVLFDHETHARDAQWTITAYETPVNDRMWHLTITPATPQPILDTLLTVLSHGDAWKTALGTPVTDKTVAQATSPLTDAGWTPAVGRTSTELAATARRRGCALRRLRHQRTPQPLDTWTIWSGPSINQPTWAIRASVYTPAGLLAEELAHGTGTRAAEVPAHHGAPRRRASRPATPGQPTALTGEHSHGSSRHGDIAEPPHDASAQACAALNAGALPSSYSPAGWELEAALVPLRVRNVSSCPFRG
ncbi:DUF317 domain-containing protein [Streptomyces sp. NPDC020192]|uniref:DUF317 domain-containing protein n=1 Tax=Streptomyces sp. NPDC020192 TaxID=3365066 RepID=UPI003796FD1C